MSELDKKMAALRASMEALGHKYEPEPDPAEIAAGIRQDRNQRVTDASRPKAPTQDKIEKSLQIAKALRNG